MLMTILAVGAGAGVGGVLGMVAKKRACATGGG